MALRSPLSLYPQPVASPLSNRDDEIQIRLDDSRFRSFPPPQRAVRRSNAPIPLQYFDATQISNDAPRNFPIIHETGYTDIPYRTSEEGFVSLTNESNLIQDKMASRSRPWMQNLQTQDKVQRHRRRQPPTKWMKWMNSDWKNRK